MSDELLVNGRKAKEKRQIYLRAKSFAFARNEHYGVWLPLVFIITFGIYLYSLLPTLGGGDSGELITAGYTLGIAHSPGYPLYALAGKLFCSIIPWANPGYAMNLFSAIIASVTVMGMCCILMYILKQRLIPIILSLLLALMPGYWIGAYQAEVFAMNGMAAVVLLGIMIICRNSTDRRADRLLVFIFGLSLGNQQTLVLLGPAIMAWIAYRLYALNPSIRLKTSLKEIPVLLIFFFLGLSIYAFLPIRSLTQPLLDWEDPETWSRFWFVVRRMRYGSFQLAQGNPVPLSIQGIIIQTAFFGTLLIESLGIVGFVFLLWGVVAACFHIKKAGNAVLLLSFLFVGPGIFFLANVPPGDNTVFIMKRFMLLPLIPACMLMAVGLGVLQKKFSFAVQWILVLVLVALLPGRMIASIGKDVIRRDDFFIRDFGKNVLKHLPYRALLFSDRADELEFAMAYFLYAEQKRPDVKFIDCNAGVSRSIYGDDYYRIWGKPRLAIREKVEKKWIKKHDGAVLYGTMDTRQVNIPMVSAGFLYRVPRTGDIQKAMPWDKVFISERGLSRGDIREKHLHQNTNSLLAQYFLDTGFLDAAEKKIDALKAWWGQKTWGVITAFWYYERKMYLKAEIAYHQVLAAYGEDANIYVYLGVLYNEQRHFVRAEDALKQALSINAAHIQAHYNLAVTYWHMGRWKDSAEEFANTVQLQPDNAEAEKFYRKARERYERKKSPVTKSPGHQ